MKTKTLLTIAFYCTLLAAKAQGKLDVRERVYLQTNTQTLLVGETLHFSAFNVSDKTGKLHDLSKTLYVELIGNSGKVFQKKIALKNGRGAGDFFVNSLISTGRYQLLAYTKWMKNFGDVFQLPITIINPFEEYTLPETSTAPSVTIYLSDNKLVAGIENKLGLSLQTADNESKDFSARIVSENNETVLTFASEKKGKATTLFTPILGHTYKIVIEDETGQFHFADLPQPTKEGCQLLVEESPSTYKVSINGVLAKDAALSLRLSSMQEELLKNVVEINTTVSIQKKDVPTGILHLELFDGEKLMATSILLHREAQLLDTNMAEKIYGLRKPVKMQIAVPTGDYTVSVRKQNDYLDEPITHTGDSEILFSLDEPYADMAGPYLYDSKSLVAFFNKFKRPYRLGGAVHFLPEHRYELLEGVAFKEDGTPAADKWISLSIPGKSFQFKTVKTDEKGQFQWQFRSPAVRSKVYLSAMDKKEKLRFQLKDKFLDKTPAFDYTVPLLDATQIKEIVSKSIRNQVENAYFYEPEEDSVSVNLVDDGLAQFTQFDFEYYMDDYTRFKTLRENIIEYIQGAVIKKNKIQIYTEYENRGSAPQLILLDGVPVDPGEVLSYNPLYIKKIGVVNRKVYLGPVFFNGFMSIETYEGNLEGYSYENSTVFDIDRLIDGKNDLLFKRDHLQEDPRPDKREQLYWNPQMSTQGNPIVVNFNTSDVGGRFLLRVEGFTEEGKPISIKRAFTVEEAFTSK